MKYRKKPEVVEACKIEIPKDVYSVTILGVTFAVYDIKANYPYITIPTKWGNIDAISGSWLIKNKIGELSVFNDKEFKDAYEIHFEVLR